MPRPRHELDAALQKLYDQIPGVADCKGLCWMSCGPIEMSQHERSRIRRAGFTITPARDIPTHGEEFWCEALGPDGRCQVYPIRPILCRIWGVSEGLRCPYGCVPEGGRFLTQPESDALIRESLRIGGDYGDRKEDTRAALLRLSIAELARQADDIRARGALGDAARAARHGGQLPEAVTRRKARQAKGLPR